MKSRQSSGDRAEFVIDGQIIVQAYDRGRADLGIAFGGVPYVSNPETTRDIFCAAMNDAGYGNFCERKIA
ncbi:MAG: hypothetical protein HYZ65_10620 [Burkholderiales bacterium]|nr:hypothetical protein [Burkholderiales bacterium]MBI3285283.1 hypothetical protein [Burkholderiales bacterium]